MRKPTITLLFICLAFMGLAQKERVLTKVLELQMPQGPGARGAQVAYHPELKRYYAGIAGNSEHAMAIFDQSGKKLSDDDLKTQFDIRGFWWSPQLNTFCANGFDDNGWVAYEMDKKGRIKGVKELYTGMLQPEDQSVGAFNPKTNELYFLDGQNIVAYSVSIGYELEETIRLHVGSADEEEAYDNIYDEDEDYLDEYYNPSLVYTGISKAEFGLLNYFEKWIELYNKKDGYVTQRLILPSDAPTDEMLCFSYANGIYWLFYREERKWIGYK